VRPGHGPGPGSAARGNGRGPVPAVEVARGAGSRLRFRPPGDGEGGLQPARGVTTMPRPGFVLDVDERTPPLLVHEGEGFRMQKFPLGTRVVYPPDPLSGIKDLNAAIRHALLNPVHSKPLPDLLTRGMRLTIAVD